MVPVTTRRPSFFFGGQAGDERDGDGVTREPCRGLVYQALQLTVFAGRAGLINQAPTRPTGCASAPFGVECGEVALIPRVALPSVADPWLGIRRAFGAEGKGAAR